MAKKRKGISHKKTAMFHSHMTLSPEVLEARAGIQFSAARPFEDPTNEERADRIPPTIVAYCKVRGDEPEGDDIDCSDLLIDMMHYAKREGHDFSKWLNMAEVNFNSEVDDEDDADPEDVELPGDLEADSDDANREMGLPEGEDWGHK